MTQETSSSAPVVRSPRVLPIIIAGVVLATLVVMLVLHHRSVSRQDVLLAEGMRQYRERDFDGAHATFLEVLKLNPKSGMALNYLGVMARDGNRLEEAEDYFRRAHEADPLSTGNAFNLAMLHFDRGRLDLAEEWLNRALKMPKAQYLMLRAAISEKRGLDPAQLVTRYRAVVDFAVTQAGTLEAEALATDTSLASAWTVATRKLLGLSDSYGLDRAAQLVTDPKPHLRLLAVRVLAGSRTSAALPALQRVLDDPDPGVAAAANEGVDSLNRRFPE